MKAKLSSFLNYLQYEKRYSEHTCAAYKTDLLQFAEFLDIFHKEPDLENAQNKQIRAWVASLMKTAHAASTTHRKLSSVRAFFKFLLQQGEIKKTPFVGIHLPKKKSKDYLFIWKNQLLKSFLNPILKFLKMISLAHAICVCFSCSMQQVCVGLKSLD